MRRVARKEADGISRWLERFAVFFCSMRFQVAAAMCFFILLSLQSAVACSCRFLPNLHATPRSLAEGASSAADVVFEGTPESVLLAGFHENAKPGDLIPATLDNPQREFTFRVLRGYKGIDSSEVKIRTGFGMGDCGENFEAEKRYVIYADKSETSDLKTGICSGNFEVKDDNATLRYLRKESPRPEDLVEEKAAGDNDASLRSPPATKVCGSLLLPAGISADDTTVYLAKEGKLGLIVEEEADANSDGTFCIEYAPPGKYLLVAVAISDDEILGVSYYPGVSSRSEATTLQIREGEQATKLVFGFPKKAQASISGKVTAENSSLPAEPTQVVLIGDVDNPILPVLVATMHPDGSFLFPNVKPGHYELLVVAEDDDDQQTSKWLTRKVAVEVSSDVTGVQLELIPRKPD